MEWEFFTCKSDICSPGQLGRLMALLGGLPKDHKPYVSTALAAIFHVTPDHLGGNRVFELMENAPLQKIKDNRILILNKKVLLPGGYGI